MKQKGFSTALILIIIVILTLGAFLIYWNSLKVTSISTSYSTVSPSPIVSIRADNFTLAVVRQEELVAYTNPKLGITFKYPKSLLVEIVDNPYQGYIKDPSLNPSFYLTIHTPDVPIEKRSQKGFDFNSYDDNTMGISIEQFDNSANRKLDDFLSNFYAAPGIDGKTPDTITLKKNLISSNIPNTGAYVYTGTLGENPTKKYFFTSKNKIYIFSLGGGNNTGESYTKDAEAIFNQIVQSIKFPDQENAVDEWKEYSDSKVGVKFSYPGKWTIESNDGAVALTNYDPKNVTQLGDGIPKNDIKIVISVSNRSIKEEMNRFPCPNAPKTTKEIEVGGKKGTWVEYGWEDGCFGGNNITIYLEKAGGSYTISIDPKDSIYLDKFKSLLSTLKFIS